MNTTDATNETSSDDQPKLLSYCSLLYATMEKGAVATSDEPGTGVVWRGRLVDTCLELGIPRGGYNRVVTVLRNLGCVELVTRGYRGKTLSEFILHYPPTDEVWAAANVKSSPDALTEKPSLDRLSSDIQALRELLGGFNLIDAFSNIENRLGKLETAVKVLKEQQGNKPTTNKNN